MTTLTVRAEAWDTPEGVALRAAQRRELDARYGSDTHEAGAEPTAESVPVFLIARTLGGIAVGCAGLRPISLTADGDVLPGGPITTAEIKRMFVAPDYRGTGVSRALLAGLEEAARGLGLDRLVLETGALQPDAMRFYEREGYLPIPTFGDYRVDELSRCYQRIL
ncbi:GNAT family N-acetyltransferase [Mycetocola spongiae]|uniref:GNAT family N-acetyltransferase n=1 Tax=Mycetocola spongiae TaxID=2859226 RepID=UPI001CF53783|nr:GNAT family N-acetyltransferase [Mycetocola spongiae]UCR88951.1 GNAT family N-acetyltransferase [Mycetocola spongiae]